MHPVKIIREWGDQKILIEFPNGKTRTFVSDSVAEKILWAAWSDLVVGVYVDPNEPRVIQGNPEAGVAALLPETIAIKLFTGQILLMSGRAIQVYKTTWTFENG